MTDDGTPRTAAGRRAVDWWEGHESFVDSEIEGGFRGAILAIEAEAQGGLDWDDERDIAWHKKPRLIEADHAD